MKTTIVLAIVLLAAYISPVDLIAQAPADIDGWNGLKWGDPVDKAIEKFGGVAVENYPLLRTMPFRLSFRTDSATGKLNGVILSAENPLPLDGYYDILKSNLVDKYGPPTYEQQGTSGSMEARWQFPKTRIDLNHYPGMREMGIFIKSQLSLIYSDATWNRPGLDNF